MTARRRAPAPAASGAPDWAELFRAAPVGLAIASGPDDTYVFVNEEFTRIAGVPASHFLGKSVAAATVGRSEVGDFGRAAAIIRRDRAGITREGVAVRLPTPGGGTRDLHLDVRIEPLLDEAGAVGGLLLVLVDVTERVAAQQRAASLERLQSAVLQQMSNAVVIVDREGRLVLLNPAARAMGGVADASTYRVGDLVTVLQVRTPDRKPLAPERSPLRRALAGETVAPSDYVMRRPTDGADIWVSYGAAPLRDEAGAVSGAFAVLSDRTTEHALREAIAASEHRLRRVYEAVGCGLLVRDTDGVIVFANHEAARIFGVPAVELVGTARAAGIRRYTESGALMTDAELPFAIAMREGRVVRDQLSRVVRADGSEIWVRVDAAPIRDDQGAVEYVVTSFVDITERKLAEDRLGLRARQQEAIAELGRIALNADDLAALFAETVRAVNGLLGAEACRVIEHDPEHHRLAVRAGQRLTDGDTPEWLPDDPAASQAGYTMAAGTDVVSNDLRSERRFRVYQPILDQGYRSTATVVIPGHDRPFGLLAAISRDVSFSAEDVTFLRAVANTLGEAIDRLAALQRVRRNEARLRTVVDNLPLDLMVYDAAGRVTLTTGRRGRGRLQTPPAVGESVYDINRQNPDGLNRIVRALRGEEVREEVQAGDTVIDMRHQPVLGPDGAVTEVVGMALDVTERAAAQAELARKEAFIRTILDSVDTDIAVLDQRGVIVDANQHWLAHTHPGETDVKNATVGDDYLTFLRDSASETDREMAAGIAAVLDGRRAAFALEFPVDPPEGRRWYQLSVQPMRSDARGVVIGHRDITERKRVEEALEHQALHDMVTDLPNRTLLRDRLRQAILAARRRSAKVGLLFIDLDRFKDLNDTFGHQAGDGVLREVGERFARAVRGSDTVARLGGDEFAVLVPQAADAEEALQVARRVLASLEAPFAVEGESAFIEASIGIVLCPEHGEDVQTLMRRADVAMYSAKRSGSGMQLYEPEKDLHSPSAIGLAGDLRHSIERRELLFHYQPMVDLRTGRCVGVEALARWQHPTRGLLGPGQFIPLAEENGFIRQIGIWSLQEALRVIGEGLGVPVIAVNLSMRNLRGNDLAPTVADLLARSGADPLRLKVEITETAMMADAEHTLAVLGELQRMGIRLSIDDFGTGYSSLAYLQRLPVDDIKVDRSFVLHMLTTPSDEAIVRSTIELAHNLGLRAIAEGVEDQATLERLSELGCDGAQGFHLGRPMPREELDAWLRASPWGLGG
jgi:diguanylate cyclase (GGDEF)-like protein/PAS domain S-box-containing protein